MPCLLLGGIAFSADAAVGDDAFRRSYCTRMTSALPVMPPIPDGGRRRCEDRPDDAQVFRAASGSRGVPFLYQEFA